MNQLMKAWLGFGFASAVAATTVLGQANPLITVDELGNMTINGTPGPPGVLAVEPISGLTTLCYQLPFPGIAGDLLATDTPTPNFFTTNDLIRFSGDGRMYFFSDRDPTDQPPFDPADVGVPPNNLQTPTAFLRETGVEGNNGFSWVPPAGAPGWDPSNPSYNFISDVPEPSSGLLTSLGGGLLLLLRWRQARRI